jgi:hypothetical protein
MNMNMQARKALFTHITELELGLVLSRWLWERGEKGGASLQKQARVRALCGAMQNECEVPLSYQRASEGSK